MRAEGCQSAQPAHSGVFATTHWSVVLAALNPQSPDATAALDQLCASYRYPLYAYVRHRGHSPEDAQDLTQEFFYRLLRSHGLASVDPCKGRFRSFLLAAMNHFLANEWNRARALKRGGQYRHVPWEDTLPEQRYLAERSASSSPEHLYERAWAIALLDQVLERLRLETSTSVHAERFDALKVILLGETPEVTYAELAARLGTTEAALKMAVRRMRHRYGELLRETIRQTVSNVDDVEDELRHLRALLSPAG